MLKYVYVLSYLSHLEDKMDLPSSRPSLVVLARHAESMRNEAKKGSVYFADDAARRKVRGISDSLIELTPRGHEQARQTGEAIRKLYGGFDYVYHSGYRRTEQTVDGILEAYTVEERKQMEIRLNLFIRERDPGHTYDMTTKEAEDTFPYLRDYWTTQGAFFAQPPGGESLAQMTQRVYLFLNMIFRDRAGQKVLVVTHGGTLRCFRFLLEHWDYEQALKWPLGQSPKNCGVTAYEYSPKAGRLELKSYNDVYWTD